MVHLTLLLLVLCAGVTASSVVDLQKRIIGGQQCGQNDRLYHVKLLAVANDGTRGFCGGSLISDRWILTATHCWPQGRTMYAILGVHPGPRPGQQGRPPVEITARPVIFSDRHQGNTRSHDIMLLKLPTRETQIQPIALPNCRNRPGIGLNVQMAGHASIVRGPNSERRPGSFPTLQCVDIAVADCRRLTIIQALNAPHRLYQHWFCGQNPPRGRRVDACFGDSGGGVIFNNMIYGVISFTGDIDYACVEAVGFMDVCHPDYFQWIQNTIRPRQNCLNCFNG